MILESTNNVMKKEETLRDLLHMNEMLVVIEKLVHNWSRNRDPAKDHAVLYATEPAIKLKEWTEAYQWVQGNQKNLIRIGEFYYSSQDGTNVTKASITNYLKYERNLN
jgi:hypothetical protein